jgi:tRNA pseudouridine55 synthase
MQGLILIDKPAGISSFGVVSRVRGIIKAKEGQKLKVGHSGTLDPLATGLLVIAIGSYTKKIPLLIKQDKTYEVCMKLGQKSATGDSEGEITDTSDVKPNLDQIKEALVHFTGELSQTPPAYSAIKVNGQRAYKLARSGKEVKLEPRPIRIIQNKLTSYNYPDVCFITEVSSGTYIRSLAEDLGEYLKTGAYMKNLRRTKIGSYKIDQAVALDQLTYSKIETSLFTLEI